MIQIDTGEKALNNSDIKLIEACVDSIMSRSFDQLRLLLSDIDSSKFLKPINKVHNALLGLDSDAYKTIWDKEINTFNEELSWVSSALIAMLSEVDQEVIKSAKINKSSNIASLGSCFATNISKHFKRLDFKNTYALRVEEAVNSPRLIDMYFNPQRVPEVQRAEWDNRFGVESKHILNIIPKIDLFILTFGVGWDLIDENNNICLDLNSLSARLMNKELKFDRPELHVQYGYISSCIESIRKLNTNAPILVTLSPVPLSGFVGYEHVVRANSISKSSLLLAIEDAKLKSDFIYLPTYEIFTSLAPIMFKEKVWGEDGTTRHPNSDLIRMVCESFVKLL